MAKTGKKAMLGPTEYDGIEITSRLMNIVLEMTLDQQVKLLEKLDEQGYENSRQFSRTCLEKPCVVIVNNRTQEESYITDICRNGMFIETEQSFKIGERVKLSFRMPASRKILRVTGQIVRSQNNGFGLRFFRPGE